MTPEEQSPYIDSLLKKLDASYHQTQEAYLAALSEGNYELANEALTRMEIIDLHRNKVEEL